MFNELHSLKHVILQNIMELIHAIILEGRKCFI